jgi:hypothetical protein
MEKKFIYEAPEMEQIELRFERCVIMGSGDSTEKPIEDGEENF